MRRCLAQVLTMVALLEAAPPAFARGAYPLPPPKTKCNAGNSSEGCGPGNSTTLVNLGEDETVRPIGVDDGAGCSALGT
jgi:hypothetical protein